MAEEREEEKEGVQSSSDVRLERKAGQGEGGAV
jgi:hypothetical protein